MTSSNGKVHAGGKFVRDNETGARFDMRQLNPADGRIILLKRTPQLTPDMLQAFADDISRRLGISAVVVAVNRLSDMREMSAADMRGHGWVREEEVKSAEKRLTLSLSYLQLVWEKATALEGLVDMSDCPHEEGVGRLTWLLDKIGEKYTPKESE